MNNTPVQIARRHVVQGIVGLTLLAGCGRLPFQVGGMPGRAPRIGFLVGSTAAATADFREAFMQGLADYGYTDDRDVVVDWRAADGAVERMPGLAEELVAMKVSAIVVPSTGDAQMVRRVTRNIPIVVAGASGDLVEDELAETYARPGGNVTGLSTPPDVVGKSLEIMTVVGPTISKVAILRQSGRDPNLRTFSLNSYERYASALGITVQVLNIERPEDIDRAFDAVLSGGAGALYVSNTPVISSQRGKIIAFAAEQRLPAMYGRRIYVDDGGLMCYWPRVTELFRRSVYFVDRILRGASPAELPLEQATSFDFVINLGTARALGLLVPPSVLAQATEIVQ